MSHQPVTQPTLLLQIRDATDEAAWSRFVKIYTPLVFGYCRQRGLQEADASDVSQEVMRTVAMKIGRFDYSSKKGSFRGWLLGVTRNKLFKYFTKLQKQPTGTDRSTILDRLEATPDASENAAWDEAYQQRLFQWAANEVRSEFTEKTWSAFWQTSVKARPSQEVADELQMSLGAVYIAKSRAIARIRKKIETVSGQEDSGLWTKTGPLTEA